jgi:hypothetical protein
VTAPEAAGPEAVDEQFIAAPGPVVSTLASWRGTSGFISFDSGDIELLDLVLSVAPDLRAVAFLGKRARQRKLRYPVASAAEVAELLDDEPLEAGEFVVGPADVLASLGPELFPIVHEGELLSAIHLALQRCRVQTTERWHRAVVERDPNRSPG